MVEDQKVLLDGVSVKSITERSKKPPEVYHPPKQEQGEPLQKYMQRLDIYNAVYWDQRNW
jgi:hypothetical protein